MNHERSGIPTEFFSNRDMASYHPAMHGAAFSRRNAEIMPRQQSLQTRDNGGYPRVQHAG
ncbi:hypothetical protein FOQG_19225 [Fusarium oxysporum f. sp. raphani 54005]|uniref:Uncharacterized protein n=1 Tax=Fusarium oxysporum f. sp. raphani 54005 TaxID=1089458 RepID=X0B1L6_FUSOX|nr:hypothetical protein FOQG_19225 [Fusarium oxysporum f. sp. raphani 54005]